MNQKYTFDQDKDSRYEMQEIMDIIKKFIEFMIR